MLSTYRDEDVARRVHRLRIRPYSDNYRKEKEIVSKKLHWYHRYRIPNPVARNPPSSSSETVALDAKKSYEETIESLIKTFPGMVNVISFAIDSWDLGPSHDLRPLLSAAYPIFGSNLRRLTLSGYLDNFRILCAPAPDFPLLDELELEFMENLFRPDLEQVAAEDGETLVHIVTPFINGFKPRLRYLKITSWAPSDLSAFMQQLGPFEALQCFSFRASFNNAFAADPSGLTSFFHDHPTVLRDVELRLKPAGSSLIPSTEMRLADWMLSTLEDETILSNLYALQIYPTMLPEGFAALLEYAQRSKDTLQELVVRDRYLLLSEVTSLVSTFSHRINIYTALKSLRLNVRTLSVELIDELAFQLPGLHKLLLFIATEDRGPENSLPGEPFSTTVSFSSPSPFHSYADIRPTNLHRKHSYKK